MPPYGSYLARQIVIWVLKRPRFLICYSYGTYSNAFWKLHSIAINCCTKYLLELPIALTMTMKPRFSRILQQIEADRPPVSTFLWDYTRCALSISVCQSCHDIRRCIGSFIFLPKACQNNILVWRLRLTFQPNQATQLKLTFSEFFKSSLPFSKVGPTLGEQKLPRESKFTLRTTLTNLSFIRVQEGTSSFLMTFFVVLVCL